MRPPGKIVVDELYVHFSALEEMQNADVLAAIRQVLSPSLEIDGIEPNVAKVNLRSGRISLLAYPAFFEDPFPELIAAWVYPPGNSSPKLRRYIDSLNPPILHRKERLVSWWHPDRARWEAITATAEALGLFEDTSTIGFKLNWQRLIASKGFELVGEQFIPLANAAGPDCENNLNATDQKVQRHLTALSRTALSAPVQMLLRHGLLTPGRSFFDYGCGRGHDVETLRQNGYDATGWDPHYASDKPQVSADTVNLGFVVNVIEDPAERVEALTRAFSLARNVLVVGVMLAGGDAPGKPFHDGYLTSRNTFQKYFSQAELKDFLELCLHRQAFMMAPGIAFVFADSNAEQSFALSRFRTRSLANRLISTRDLNERIPQRLPRENRPRPARGSRRFAPTSLPISEEIIASARPVLVRLWQRSLDLGRLPDRDEVTDLTDLELVVGSLKRAVRLLPTLFDMRLLAEAARIRSDDLKVFMASQHFAKRPSYRLLAPRLQRDIKTFFGDYKAAQEAGWQLLMHAAEPAKILEACKLAATCGLGYLDAEHSLQIHVSLVERLPPVLRTFVACGLQIWDSLSDVQLVKIHISSGKLTLMQFDGFDESPLPLLRRRIKIHVRRLTYDLFEYGTSAFPQTALYRKSRFISEEYPGYAEQLAFDEEIERLGLVNDEGFGPSPAALSRHLMGRRLVIDGTRLVPSSTVPHLDDPCGSNFTYRNFIECGETQQRLRIGNVPSRAETYNALHGLCVHLLDPLIEYFGAIRLTYGFASQELTKHIPSAIAPRLDQHASCEVTARGAPICARGGAACDFVVEDEDMRAVADWVIANLPFDRLYYYGGNRPVHLSFSNTPSGTAFEMTRSPTGRLMPRPLQATARQGSRST
jgi:DNA phosphorothioation-associated putative methyltransferase